MRIFITATFKESKNKKEIEHLCSLVRDSGFEDFCFIRDVEHYQKTFTDPKELMSRVKKEIEKSDILLIDMSDIPTGGRAIEAGMAYALNKKIIILIKKGTTIKNTSIGISNYIIEYEKLEDIMLVLKNLYSSEHTP